MPKLYIGTNEEKIRYGNKSYMENYPTPATRFAIITVSNAVYDALMGGEFKTEKQKEEIAFELYSILEREGMNNN